MELGIVVAMVLSGIFNASWLFLLSAGLQILFGVQKVFNIACGTIFVLGAYLGVTFVNIFLSGGLPKSLFIIPLICAGLSSVLIGPLIERGLLRFVYGRDVHFQLLIFFALSLIIEDIIRMVWGVSPRSTPADLYGLYGQIDLLGSLVPVYNFVVILISLMIAAATGYILIRTRFGKIIRAQADNSEMVEALGINTKRMGLKVFTFGTVLGTLGGALIIPSTAAIADMGAELLVLGFAIIVIGGLGSMRGALVGALIVGILRSITIMFYPELELFIVYLIVIVSLVYKPEGIFGKKGF
ncbi:MAG: branched-chain amino acid ABC transporter permease [Thermodesulfobacteriota bacterium]